MGLFIKAGAAFAVAAFFAGEGPFAASLSPHWRVVAAELAAARPEARLAAQVQALFQSGALAPPHAKKENQDHA